MSDKLPGIKKLTETFAYLDALRESGATNMYGAVPYLIRDMGFDRDGAVPVLSAWMKSFSKDKPKVRAQAALQPSI